jgi:hypothetical protein
VVGAFRKGTEMVAVLGVVMSALLVMVAVGAMVSEKVAS